MLEGGVAGENHTRASGRQPSGVQKQGATRSTCIPSSCLLLLLPLGTTGAAVSAATDLSAGVSNKYYREL
jgi:hypothetical protein